MISRLKVKIQNVSVRVGLKFAFAQGLLYKINVIRLVAVKWEEIRGVRKSCGSKTETPQEVDPDPTSSRAIPAPPYAHAALKIKAQLICIQTEARLLAIHPFQTIQINFQSTFALGIHFRSNGDAKND